jgi:hypothetical protein
VGQTEEQKKCKGQYIRSGGASDFNVLEKAETGAARSSRIFCAFGHKPIGKVRVGNLPFFVFQPKGR